MLGSEELDVFSFSGVSFDEKTRRWEGLWDAYSKFNWNLEGRGANIEAERSWQLQYFDGALDVVNVARAVLLARMGATSAALAKRARDACWSSGLILSVSCSHPAGREE